MKISLLKRVVLVLLCILYASLCYAAPPACLKSLENDFILLNTLLIRHEVKEWQIIKIRHHVREDMKGCPVPETGIDISGSVKEIDFAIIADDAVLVKKIVDHAKDRGTELQSLNGVSGSTPLHAAAYLGTPDTMAILLATGYEVNVKDGYGNTPLMEAPGGVEKNAENVKFLVKRGAAINMVTSKGNTALLSAIVAQDVPAIKYLLAQGALTDLPCSRVTSPKEVAIRVGNKEIVNLISQWHNKSHVHISGVNDKVICEID